MAAEIPVIDFSRYSLAVDADKVPDSVLLELGQEVYQALATAPFLLLKNCGIEERLVRESFTCSRQFFELPAEVKQKYRRPDDPHDDNYNGWVGQGVESVNPEGPVDLKESFSYALWMEQKWPHEVVSFKPTLLNLNRQAMSLGKRILQGLALAMGLDRHFFDGPHKGAGTRNSMTATRCNYYPEITDETVILPNQMRIGEHADYVTLTLLFQDDQGGLEVKTKDGTWCPVLPVPGTVGVFVDLLLQRWTADKLKATVHRVIMPGGKCPARQSIIQLIAPDDDVEVKCVDGSDTYEPVNARSFVTGIFDKTY
ncbi:UPF0676 protein C1494.01 isoform X1 [Lingula anatina]|uniref:UPF0676 protein C1494.01 isoform X1 n=1 Tax=Lingula anatina TaxID=7574 RepID=A0A1S3I205_LINAN|nr:UPF0676 protein C1494.01 isoform X2 [Lingula anatina]XP_013391380.1 UPF0676 protein C1494.01 isoform X1 [Lingula anatina]|eukprot:XP_013391379.1 UPF0676 protein C1494.01 isoform X2 [Lingula anatina]